MNLEKRIFVIQQSLDICDTQKLAIMITYKAEAVKIANHFRNIGYSCLIEPQRQGQYGLTLHLLTITKPDES